MPAVAPRARVGPEQVLSEGPALRPDDGKGEVRGDPVGVEALAARPQPLRYGSQGATDGAGLTVAMHGDLEFVMARTGRRTSGMIPAITTLQRS